MSTLSLTVVVLFLSFVVLFYGVDNDSSVVGESSDDDSSSGGSSQPRLISAPPGESSDDDSTSGGPSPLEFAIWSIILAAFVTVLVCFICCNLRNDEDDVEYAPHAPSIANHALPPVPPSVANVNNRGAPTVTDHRPLAAPTVTDHRHLAAPTVTDHRPLAAPIADRPKDGSKPDRATVLREISSNELAIRDSAAAAARVSNPGTSRTRSLRDAKFGPISFSYEDLRNATQNFSADNLLGEGGFGKVYKGFLSDNTIVAVKELKSKNTEGEREFINEVKTISSVKHKNIVRLVGYCITDFSRCIVYEYMENKTLHDHIQGGEGIKTMEWPIRMKIATDVAKGIAYLHEDCTPRIIHRDIKPANILLDNEFVAKVADFGIAKLCAEHFKSHIASSVLGSFGFIDPAYAETRELTFESDVYSFGVVLLQLVSAVTDLPMLYQLRMEQLPRALESGNFLNIADPRLNNNYVHDEMALILTCAEACCRKDPKDRPPMIQVSRVLERLISANELRIKNIRRQGV